MAYNSIHKIRFYPVVEVLRNSSVCSNLCRSYDYREKRCGFLATPGTPPNMLSDPDFNCRRNYVPIPRINLKNKSIISLFKQILLDGTFDIKPHDTPRKKFF